MDNKNSISAKPDNLQVYSFNAAGGLSDQLPMKQKKGTKGVSNYPLTFFEKILVKPKFDSGHSDELQITMSVTKHTFTTSKNRVSHKKHISTPISEFVQ